MALRVACACLVAVCVACGGATTNNGSSNPRGSATVSGTIDGKPVPANDAIARQLTTTTGIMATSRTISITSAANACPCGIAAGYSTALALTVGVAGTTVPTGTYSFPSGGNAGGGGEAQYVVDNPGTTLLVATSGSITLSQVTPSLTVGTFEIAFPNGDHVAGTFSAPTCGAAEAVDACP